MKKITSFAAIVLATLSLQGCVSVHYSNSKENKDISSVQYLKYDKFEKRVTLQYKASSTTDRQKALEIANDFCSELHMTAKSSYLEKTGDQIVEVYECKNKNQKSHNDALHQDNIFDDDKIEELF